MFEYCKLFVKEVMSNLVCVCIIWNIYAWDVVREEGGRLTLRMSSTSMGRRSSWGSASPSSPGGSIPGPPPVRLLTRRNWANVLAVRLFCTSLSETALVLAFARRYEYFFLKNSFVNWVPNRRLKLRWTHVQASLTFSFWLSDLKTRHQ